MSNKPGIEFCNRLNQEIPERTGTPLLSRD